MNEIKSINQKANKLLVMLHGIGSDGEDLIGLVPFMQKSLPDYHFFAPNGVERYEPSGYQWFSILDRSPKAIMQSVLTNTPQILNLIQSKQRELGITNTETVLLGFSQGTMIASYLTFSADEPYHAMVGYSGRLIPPPQLKNTSTPICIIHGEDDDIVEANESDVMQKYCNKHGISNQLKIIPNLKHSIDMSGIECALNFLKT